MRFRILSKPFSEQLVQSRSQQCIGIESVMLKHHFLSWRTKNEYKDTLQDQEALEKRPRIVCASC